MISKPIDEIKPSYDVVIVGSGYGGSVAAARLSLAIDEVTGKRLSVCLLERGREFLKGDFPDSPSEIAEDWLERSVFGRESLFDIYDEGDLNVVVGSGLGGTSLINANVAMEPPFELISKSTEWPKELRSKIDSLRSGYSHAQSALDPKHYPNVLPELPKARAHRDYLGEEARSVPLTVRFDDGPNALGSTQAACVMCGNCVSGCNYDAKGTTARNYLPYASHNGVDIFTEVTVNRVRKIGDDLAVYYDHLYFPEKPVEDRHLTARVVILAAGALGSPKILSVSSASGPPPERLAVSSQLGQRFNGNGDRLFFAYNSNTRSGAVGARNLEEAERSPVGPTILRSLQVEKDGARGEIQDGAFPAAIGAAVTARLRAATDAPMTTLGRDRETDSALLGPRVGAVDQTHMFLAMETGPSHWRLDLPKQPSQRPKVLGTDKSRPRGILEGRIKLGVEQPPHAATVVPGPHVLPLGDDKDTTVHPLGGCVMGDSGATGVVDHSGRLFKGDGEDVHENIYIMDGSIVPSALGVNPFMTIASLAERNVRILVEQRGWTLETAAVPKLDGLIKPSSIGLEFTEGLLGHVSRCEVPVGESLEHQEYHAAGRAHMPESHPFSMTMRVSTEDLDALMNDENPRPAKLHGQVETTLLRGHTTDDTNSELPDRQILAIHGGLFELFDKQGGGKTAIKYSGDLIKGSTKVGSFVANKVVSGFWSRLLEDSRTLLIDVTMTGQRYIGTVRNDDVMVLNQLGTFRVTHAPDTQTRFRKLVEFERHFRGNLVDIVRRQRRGERMPERTKGTSRRVRPLSPIANANHSMNEMFQFRDSSALHVNGDKELVVTLLPLPEPEIHNVKTLDQGTIRLAKYTSKGGDKGPIVVAPGFGMKAEFYAPKGLPNNLPAQLLREGYDVWLFDYRGSPVMPDAAMRSFTLDDIAQYDWPAALQSVAHHYPGKDTEVRVFAHCVGAMTLLMALASPVRSRLSSLKGAVLSSLGLHASTEWTTQLKVGLQLPTGASVASRVGNVLSRGLGPQSLDDSTFRDWMASQVVVQGTADIPQRLIEGLFDQLRVPGGQQPPSESLRRLFWIYGILADISMMSDEVLEELPSFFGDLSLTPFRHVAKILRAGHAVDAVGRDVYLGSRWLAELDVPLHFVHGANNRMFLPASTENTKNLLGRARPGSQHTWKTFHGFGHLDLLIGRRSAQSFYPFVVEMLAKM